jgi:hypothetical protein
VTDGGRQGGLRVVRQKEHRRAGVEAEGSGKADGGWVDKDTGGADIIVATDWLQDVGRSSGKLQGSKTVGEEAEPMKRQGPRSCCASTGIRSPPLNQSEV